MDYLALFFLDGLIFVKKIGNLNDWSRNGSGISSDSAVLG